MEVAPTPSREHHGTCQRFIDQIRIEMDVEDATGELIGKVIYIRLAGCFATGEFSEVAPVPSVKFGMDDRDVEQGPATGFGRMLPRSEFFKFDAQRRRQWDRHYYAMAEDIAAIDADTVRLCTPLDDLLTPYT